LGRFFLNILEQYEIEAEAKRKVVIDENLRRDVGEQGLEINVTNQVTPDAFITWYVT